MNDAVGRRTLRIDAGSAVSTNVFGYNSRSELTTALMDANLFAWELDPIGNRVSDSSNSVTHSYTANALNQYTQITNGGLRTLVYDLDGNLTNDGVFAYSWDSENRMIAAVNGSTVAQYSYDYMSRRYRKIVSGVTNNFVYDGWNLVAELSNNGSQIITNRYVWGLDLSGTLQGAGGIGGLLSVTRNGVIYFPCYDANGNITDYVDITGAVVAHREYDAYGNTLVASGSMVNEFSFWFSSKYLDRETGLYYYGYRYYLPEVGRWASRDPLEEDLGGLNLYNFVYGDAINAFDMLGLKKCGVSSFVVKWKVGVGHGLDVAITFRNDGDYDPRCCEYKQNAGDNAKVTRNGRVIFNASSPLEDDHYSRDDYPDPWSGNTDRTSSTFTTWDTPGFVANYLKEGDVIKYSFTAEQIVYSPGRTLPGTPQCNCEKNDNVAKKGPHTGTVRGTFSRRLRYSGAPATL